MDETTVFKSLLREYCDTQEVSLEPLASSDFEDGYLLYQVQCSDEINWVARAYRRDRPVTDWFRYFYLWCTDDTADWLTTRAATLVWLEQQNYPVPFVIRTKHGELIAKVEGWCILIMAFVEGQLLKPTIHQLNLLGETFGRLHTLNLDQAFLTQPPVGKSVWHLEHAIPNALTLLDSIETRLPEIWISLHADFRQTMQQMEDYQDLPSAIIHADGWAANAIQVGDSGVILIDWENGGLGLAVLDLGQILLECHVNSDLPPGEPEAWHIQPDADRIAAVVDGYVQQRQLSPAELDALPSAIRFGIAFLGLLHMYQACHVKSPSRQWLYGMKRRFARIRNRWDVSQEIATLAQKRFEARR